MDQKKNTRRYFLTAGLKTGMAASLLSCWPWQYAYARTEYQPTLDLPDNINTELTKLFPQEAIVVHQTSELRIKAPEIAENGMVVPFNVESEPSFATSIALFVEMNPDPLTAFFELQPGVDLAIGTRVRLRQTSRIYAIAQTPSGLVGTMSLVKVTIGCGGA